MRTFIAVPLPDDCHTLLADLQSKMRPLGADVRWTAPASIHLTLKFLGEVDAAEIPRMTEALRAATIGVSGFQLRLQGLGGFPNMRSPRVIWCGVEGDTEKASALQQAVEKVCNDFGFPPEDRPFHPHLTLGRVQGKRNLQPLLDYIKIAPGFERTFPADRYNIYKSVLSPRGAVYSILETIELTGH